MEQILSLSKCGAWWPTLEGMPRHHKSAGQLPDDTRGDRELVRQCETSESARGELYRQHAPALYRLILLLTGNPSDAEDVLQEVFVQALRSLHTYRGEASLRAWLRRIAVRGVARHRSKRGRTVSLHLVGEPAAAPRDAAAEAHSRAALERLYELLERLNDAQRAVFILHEVAGHPLAEVAALSGISLRAATNRVWRARQKLERLARHDPLLRGYVERKGKRDD